MPNEKVEKVREKKQGMPVWMVAIEIMWQVGRIPFSRTGEQSQAGQRAEPWEQFPGRLQIRINC